jgi:nicotinate-nucleotide adenylyltransferase
MKERIGLFGGTFNPIHNGHIEIAKTAMERLHLNKVIFIPSFIPHFKSLPIASFSHRYKMVSLAIDGFAEFSVSDIESKRKGKSYTINIVRYFKKKTNADLYFIAGSDSLLELHKWKDYKDLLKVCHFVVFNRPNFPVKRSKIPVNMVSIIRNKEDGISSTMIRERIRDGLEIKELVSPMVEIYIDCEQPYND